MSSDTSFGANELAPNSHRVDRIGREHLLSFRDEHLGLDPWLPRIRARWAGAAAERADPDTTD